MLRQKLIETLDSFGAIPAADDYANGYNNCRKIIVPLIRETIDAWTKEGNGDDTFIIDTDEGNLVLSQADILNTIDTDLDLMDNGEQRTWTVSKIDMSKEELNNLPEN